MSNYNLLNSNTEQFCNHIRNFGLEPPIHLEPGKWHRFPGVDKNNRNTAGWCMLFPNGFGGAFGDFSSGLSESWQSRDKIYSKQEQEIFKKNVQEARLKMEQELLERHLQAKNVANKIWHSSSPASDRHSYLVAKNVNSYGLRTCNEERLIAHMNCKDSLIVPIMQEDIIWSLQFINSAGEKRFLTGAKKSGGYFLIGEINRAVPLCLAEGYATAVSVHMATGYPVIVTFDSGNIEDVAISIRKRFPEVVVIICADDDHTNKNNPGLKNAISCAKLIGAKLAIPNFSKFREENDKDFNDLHNKEGFEAVNQCIQSARLCTYHVTPSETLNEKIRFSFGNGYFEVSSKGVFFIGKNTDGEELPPYWVCSPLHVIAKTRDDKSGEWGRLLKWQDDDQVMHQWAMPLELLQGDGADVRKELSRLGLTIAPGKKARELLSSYLQICNVEARARCVNRLGWYGTVYVTSSESIGENNEIIVFQNTHAIEPAFSISGTVEDWRNKVGKLISGNSRLIFATSISFAAVLANLAVEDSGGFHFRGSSSSGKTTALKIAASIWGNPEKYLRLWRSTANGLEGLAALHNDGLLILDELSQIDPKEAGESAYLLANGQGKTRASRNGSAKQAFRWRLLFLSAGEESLSALMARAGHKANIGQEIRLADIEADAGNHMGIFDNLHEAANPASFSLTLKDAASQYYGAVGKDWIDKVVANKSSITTLITTCVKEFVEKSVPLNASGQIFRVARRFGLVAIAGELATEFGLTGWEKGESTSAAQICFKIWLQAFGGTDDGEKRQILSQVRGFFEAYGGSRFEDIRSPNNEHTYNRAGFFREGHDGHREYLVLSEIFTKEICKGFNPDLVVKVLLEKCWLIPASDRTTQKPRIKGVGSPRCYVFNSNIWSEDEV